MAYLPIIPIVIVFALAITVLVIQVVRMAFNKELRELEVVFGMVTTVISGFALVVALLEITRTGAL